MVSENVHTEQIARREISSLKRISAPCAPRVIVIGFNSILCLVKDEEGQKSLPAASPSEKQSGSSTKSGLTSSFETLLSSPRHTPVNKDLETVDLGLVTALNSDPEFSRNDDSSKTIAVTGDDYMAPGISVRSCRSEQQQSVIAQSKLQRHDLNSSKFKTQVPLCSQAATRNTESYVLHRDVEVERRVFSFLAASPGTLKGRPEHTACLATMDFMETCFLCKRHLREDLDIFMYKGDKAFCSEECRYQQIETDERAESRKKFSSAALKTGSSIQSRHRKTKVLSASTAAPALWPTFSLLPQLKGL